MRLLRDEPRWTGMNYKNDISTSDIIHSVWVSFSSYETNVF